MQVFSTEAILICADHVFYRFEGEIRVDRTCAIADQQRHVVDFTSIATLHDETDLGPLLFANEMVMNSRGE